MYNNLAPYDPKTANYIHAKLGLEKFLRPNTHAGSASGLITH